LTGIINGIDYDHWNPATDVELAANFDKDNLANKKKNKNQLLKDNLLPVKRKEVPVFGIISRLVDQKGFDIFSAVADEIMQMDLQMVVLGTGDPKYHQLFKHLKDKYPKKLAVHLKFDAYTAKMIYAGSDFFLMPSRFEPCGLGQMIALAYGTIPMVRATGGLVDTIRDYDPVTKQGNGLVFYDYNEGELLHTIKRAIDIFHQKDSWMELRQNAIRSDFSWDVSAQRFTELYQSLSTA
jgi:starch synthase